MATDGTVSRWNADATTHLPAYSAGDERLLDSPLLMPGPASAVFSARSGRRVNGAGLAVSVGGSPEAWTVTAGAGVIFDSGNASAGAWRFAIPNAKSAQLPARPGSGLSRIDLIVARIYDTDVLGTGAREIKIEHVPGTPGSSPSAPATPALSLVLATLSVPNAGGISVTQSGARAVAAGGIVPVATLADLDALKTAGIAYEGLVADVAATDALYRYNGTNWAAIQNQQYAAPTVPTVDGNATGPNGAPILMRIGYHEITTTGTTYTQAFVTPFPNGVLHISPTTITGIDAQPTVDAGALTKTQFRLAWKGAANTAIKFSYVAWGW